MEQIAVLKAFLTGGEDGIAAWGVEEGGSGDFS